MKLNLVVIVLLLMPMLSFGQRDLTPNKKGSAFGKRDLRSLSNYGIQFELGATYMLTRPNKANTLTAFSQDGISKQYSIDPSGRIGGYAEIGMMFYPKNRSKLSLALKTVLVSYYDFGLGFKYFRSQETMEIDRLSPTGAVLGTATTEGQYNAGNIYGRFSLHKEIHFKNVKKFYLDNSIGVNVEYNILADKQKDGDAGHIAALSAVGAPQHYHGPFIAQLHYGLGLGFRLKRGSYLIPGARIPILGINEWHKGNPSMKWFSRSYWPILFNIKYMFLLEKKAKSCPAVETNDQDKKTQRNR